MAEKEEIIIDKKDMEKLHKEGRVEVGDVDLVYIVDSNDDDVNQEEELDELVDYDGSIKSSAIPDGWENNKTISATKTTDATVHMSRQGPGIAGGAMGLARRYWLEENEDLDEEDMSVVLGFDETMHMNGDETIEYFKDEHDMGEDEAKERSQAMGKNEGPGDFQRLVEDDDVIKMLEIILNKNDEDLTVQSHDNVEDSMLDRKIRHFVKYVKNKGYDMDNVVNRLKNE
jgi:hypothetical protein